jgi:hypothetical protein
MAYPNPSYGDVAATTIENRLGEMADNVTKNNALLSFLSKKNKIKLVRGGRSIVQELAYAETGTYQRYYGYEPLDVDASQTFTAAEFDYKQVAVSITASGLEAEVQNVGREATIDLVEARAENAEYTMMNGMSQDVYSDGTASGGRQIGGLQLIIADTGLGTVGGIPSDTWTFWQNKKFSASTDGGFAASASNMNDYMTRLWVQLQRGVDKPDFGVADNNFWRIYQSTLTAIARTESDKAVGELGFPSLKYMGFDIMLDGGQGGFCPTNHLYMGNSKYLFFRPAAARNMKRLGKREAVNQDSFVEIVAWAGNLTTSNRSLLGVLTA